MPEETLPPDAATPNPGGSVPAEEATSPNVLSALSAGSAAPQDPQPGEPSAAPVETAPSPEGSSAPESQAPTEVTPGPTEVPAAAPAAVLHPDVLTHLNAIENIAVYWGGENGVAIRNLVGRIREHLPR